MPPLLAVGPLEVAQDHVPALHGAVQRLLGVCWPWKAFSISSCMITRISGMLPSRRPIEFSVGSVSVSWRNGMSAPGFLM